MVSRRALLTGGTVAGISGVAGCLNICPQEFTAPLARLPNPESHGLQPAVKEELVVHRNILGDRTIRSHWVVYDTVDGGAVAPIGVLSTPLGTCLGQALNPVATAEFDELLTNERLGSEFVELVIADVSDTSWVRGPTAHATWSATLLEIPVSIRAFTGLVRESDGTLTALVIGVARAITSGDAVLVGGGIATTLADDVAPSGVDVVPGAVSTIEVADLKTLLQALLPAITTGTQDGATPTTAQPGNGYGEGGYGHGGYGGVGA